MSTTYTSSPAAVECSAAPRTSTRNPAARLSTTDCCGVSCPSAETATSASVPMVGLRPDETPPSPSAVELPCAASKRRARRGALTAAICRRLLGGGGRCGTFPREAVTEDFASRARTPRPAGGGRIAALAMSRSYNMYDVQGAEFWKQRIERENFYSSQRFADEDTSSVAGSSTSSKISSVTRAKIQSLEKVLEEEREKRMAIEKRLESILESSAGDRASQASSRRQ